MSGHWTADASFIDAYIGPNGVTCAAIVHDDLAATRVPFTKAAVLSGGQWLDGGSLQWDASRVVRCLHPMPQYAVVGVDGFVQFIGGGDIHQEKIDDQGMGPPGSGVVRGAKSIEGTLHVCCMNRHVYRREGRDSWRCLTRALPESEGVRGFEAIDGFAQNDVYAVGWEGEVWHWDGRAWTARDAGTNTVLIDVVCAGDGNVYVLGRGRALVIGRGDAWQSQTLRLPVDLGSIAWFNGRLYACSTRDIFEWDGLQFVPMRIAGDRPRTFQYLKAGEGGLCTVGPKDLFLFDGSTWTRLD